MTTICVDFDGVIHRFSKGWHNGTIYDPPVPGAMERLAQIAKRNDIIIYSSREQPVGIREWIVRQQGIAGVQFPFIVDAYKPAATLYIDDNGWRFKGWDDQKLLKIMGVK